MQRMTCHCIWNFLPPCCLTHHHNKWHHLCASSRDHLSSAGKLALLKEEEAAVVSLHHRQHILQVLMRLLMMIMMMQAEVALDNILRPGPAADVAKQALSWLLPLLAHGPRYNTQQGSGYKSLQGFARSLSDGHVL